MTRVYHSLALACSLCALGCDPIPPPSPSAIDAGPARSAACVETARRVSDYLDRADCLPGQSAQVTHGSDLSDGFVLICRCPPAPQPTLRDAGAR